MSDALDTVLKPQTKQGKKLLGHVAAYYETGDERELEAVFVRLRPYVLGYLGSKLQVYNPQRREDIGQEVLVLILTALRSKKFALASPTTGLSASVLAYSCRVCFNYFVSLGRAKPEPAHPGAHEDPFLLVRDTSSGAFSEADININADLAAKLLAGLTQIVASLPDMQRTAVTMVYFQGWGLTAAANSLQMHLSSFRNHLRKGLGRLRESAQKQGITELSPELYAALPKVDTGQLFDERRQDSRPGKAPKKSQNETTPLTGMEAPYQSATPQPSSLMTAYVHPKPSPALHFLNTPERIEHDAAHPDNAHTSAVAAIAPTEASPFSPYYDLATVISHYLRLTPTEGDTEWTHWGPSPFVKGDTHSLAVNTDSGIYRCATSRQTGKVLDFVMFMEECDQVEGLAWLMGMFPSQVGVGQNGQNGQKPAETDKVDMPTESVPDGPACAYPGYPTPTAPIAAHPPTPSPLGEGSAPDFAELTQATAEAAAPAAPAAPVAVEGTIYSTTNYDLFHLLPQNRVIDQGQVRKLVIKITQKNLLHIKPLDVTADLGIIDGQHRWAAARELGVPIYYKVGQQLSEDDIAILNETSKNWAGTDYLHLWTVQGKPDYQTLTDFLARHPRISFSNAKMMLSGSTNNRVEEFRAGRWKVDDTYRAERVAEMVERIAADVKSFKQPNHTGFVAALYHCVSNVGGFDSNEMLRTILKQPMSLVPCASHKQWLEMLSKIYNWHKNAANQIRFE